MNYPHHFRNNLQALKEERGLSLTGFSQLLDMSRSTLQAVMSDGQTTLDTACRIANALQLPLSTLTGGELLPDKAEVLHSILVVVDWYSNLTIFPEP